VTVLSFDPTDEEKTNRPKQSQLGCGGHTASDLTGRQEEEIKCQL